jgi:hypothetical protein
VKAVKLLTPNPKKTRARAKKFRAKLIGSFGVSNVDLEYIENPNIANTERTIQDAKSRNDPAATGFHTGFLKTLSNHPAIKSKVPIDNVVTCLVRSYKIFILSRRSL